VAGIVRRVPEIDETPEPLAARRTMTNLLAVTGARVGLLACWFAATGILARTVGPAPFGLYTLVVSAIRIATGLAGDPVDAAVMRSAPLHVRTDRPRALAVVRSGFVVRGAVGLSCIALAGAMPWAASWAIFGVVDQRRLAVLTAVGVLGDLLLRSVLGYFQIAETFGRFLAVDVVWQLGRAVAVIALVELGRLGAGSAVAVYVFAPYVAYAAGLLLMPRDVIRPTLPSGVEVTTVLRAASWVAAATAVGAVYERLDLFLLARFRSETEVGLYGGAMFLASIPDFIDGCVQTVLAPRVAPTHAARRFNQLNRQYLQFAIPLGLLAGLIAVGLGGWGVRTFLSTGYAGSIGVFRLLVVGTLFNLMVTPLSSALLNYVAPRASATITAVGLAIVAIGGLAVIPRYGAIGAAGTIVTARIVAGTATAATAWHLGRRPVRLPAGS
jgi:O-antigen/teichoic acid export membrane protein